MKVDEVWQAWTENEKDPIAADLLDKYKKVKARLVKALRSMEKERPGAAPKALSEAFEIMSFFGVSKKDGETEKDGETDDSDKKTDDAYTSIKEMIAGKDRVRYRSPGDVVDLGDTGVKVFVLGPPKSVAAIGKDDPGAKDGYHKQKSAFFNGFSAILGAVESSLADGSPEKRAGCPFSERQAVPIEAAQQTEFFRQLYSFGDAEHPEAFRGIDDLAAESLGSLALRLDSHINNTSLVLAFQLPDGKVLLFPGDAQAGNWKSWAARDKPLAFTQPKTDAHELLKNTVFYKVGHHGSHNATPRTYGLELMTNPELRAFVPVDHVIAQSAGYGEMPLIEIMNELTRRTGGFVVRSDEVTEAPAKMFVPSKKTLAIKNKKEGVAFTRPMYCEMTYDLND
jgi:hypothetical protein